MVSNCSFTFTFTFKFSVSVSACGRYVSGGAHGVFALLPACDAVSVYGFTTYPSCGDTKDQYAGNEVRSGGSGKYHDWLGEQYVWRLLNVAGLVDICSM